MSKPYGAWKPRDVDLERVPCPACDGTRVTLLARTDRYDMDVHTVGCEACGLVYTNPRLTARALDDFYRERYRTFYQGDPLPSLATIARLCKDVRCAEAVDFLRREGVLREGGMRVLDVGASEGVLLRAVRTALPDSERFAVEPNAAYGTFAIEHAGCRWFDSLDALRAARLDGFHLVSMVHVFEHVNDPVRTLRELAALLAPGGAIYLDVPDVTRYGRLDDLHIAHIVHFGPDTLTRVAARAGLAVRVLQRHEPKEHPKSIRAVLSIAPDTPVSSPTNRREGWTQTRRAGRHVWAKHRRRWPWWRRLAHMVSG